MHDTKVETILLSESIEMEQTGRRRGTVIWHRALVNQNGETVQEGDLETVVELALPKKVESSE